MFEDLDLKIGEETKDQPEIIIHFTQQLHCTVTASGGYGTSCKYCC